MKSKKSTNVSRLKRLRQAIDELNYVSRVLTEIIGPYRQRREALMTAIQEGLQDEGIPTDVESLKIDDVKGTIEWEEKPKEKPVKGKRQAAGPVGPDPTMARPDPVMPAPRINRKG